MAPSTPSTNSSANFIISKVKCLNLSKCNDPIDTGIGFFDHMLDQLNSHAQVGISVTVDSIDGNKMEKDCGSKPSKIVYHNRHANPAEMQEEIARLVGLSIGSEINSLFPWRTTTTTATATATATRSNNALPKTSRFCCPLDEALVECILTTKPESSSSSDDGNLTTFALEPYGEFPKGGRRTIGSLQTACVRTFFEALAHTMQVDISLIKIRGSNGHHIVESSFKAFSRALRNLLDGVDIDSMDDSAYMNSGNNADSMVSQSEEKKREQEEDPSNKMEALWGYQSESYQLGISMKREGVIERSTKETSILVDAKLYGGDSPNNNVVSIQTGILMLDQIFHEIAIESGIQQLNMICKGDLHVDDHHSAEDVAIAFGQVINKALGTKAGLNRMWLGKAKMGDCDVEVTMDLSNRPCLTSNLSLETISPNGEESVNGLSVEMVDHVFDSIVMNGHMTVHIVEKAIRSSDSSLVDLIIATSRAFGRALRMCMAVDPRRKGSTASSKGTLSV